MDASLLLAKDGDGQSISIMQRAVDLLSIQLLLKFYK